MEFDSNGNVEKKHHKEFVMKLRKNINETDSQTYDKFNEKVFDTLYAKLKYPFRNVLDKT